VKQLLLALLAFPAAPASGHIVDQTFACPAQELGGIYQGRDADPLSRPEAFDSAGRPTDSALAVLNAKKRKPGVFLKLEPPKARVYVSGSCAPRS
jgi:hypothetical protein